MAISTWYHTFGLKRLALSIIMIAGLALSSQTTNAQCVYGWGNLAITAPTAGSSWATNSTMTIRWSQGSYNAGYYYMTYKLDYSSNNGSTWVNIVSGINGFTTSYAWTLPLNLTPTTTYRLRVSEVPDYYNFGCAFQYPGQSGTFTVFRACSAPTISAQPTSRTVCTGQPTTFTVASDMATGTYEWFRDGVLVGTTRTPSYTIANVTLASGGLYSVTLRDDCDPAGKFTNSSTARLTVIESPAVTVNLPATRIVCESANDTLRIRAVGAGRSFQWYKDGVAIPGATDSNYVVNNAQATSTGKYYCMIAGTCTPPATSATCDLTVAAKPRITRNPVAVTACPGSSGNAISVTATGLNLAYQWYKDGVRIDGATSSTLTFNNYDYSMNGQYYCLVRSDIPNPNNCAITAQSSTVRVSGYRVPTISVQPKNTIACAGGTTTLVSEFAGTGLTYQWFKDGKALAGQASNTLVLSSIKADAAGRYVVVATGTCGLSTTSDTASVTVITKPTITKQPENTTLTVGERLTLTVDGTDLQSVQWYKNDLAIKDATTTTYSIPSVVKANSGFYSARITNTCGGVVSVAAKVEVNDPVVPRPAIELAETSVDFGEIPAGYSKSTTLAGLIKNVGNAPLTITEIKLSPSDFSLSNAPTTPFDIAPGADQTLVVIAAPTSKGTVNGSMTIRSNAPLTPQTAVALSAKYVLRYDAPASQDYGQVETGASSEKCVTLTNNSSQVVTIDQASVIGVNAAEFSVVTAMPLTIAAGGTAEICVKFNPGTVGTKTAQLSIRSSNGGNSSVELRGRGETPGGVIDAVEAGIGVFPNPATDVLELRFGKAMPAMLCSIVNAAGSVVASMNVESLDAGSTIRWNIADKVASGAYTLVVRYGENATSLPVTVVR